MSDRHEWTPEQVSTRPTVVYEGQRVGPSGEFVYSPWRHGGWYVDNVRYPSGAVGCVSRNYTDRKWRIACDPRPGSFPGGPNDHTYRSRDEAAAAERDLIVADILAAQMPAALVINVAGTDERFDAAEGQGRR